MKTAVEQTAIVEQAAVVEQTELEKYTALRPEDSPSAILERIALDTVRVAEAKVNLSFNLGSLARLLIHNQDIATLNAAYWKLHETQRAPFRKAIVALMGGVEPNPDKGGFFYNPENSYLRFTQKDGFTRTVEGNANWMKRARMEQLEGAKPLLALFAEDYTMLARLKTRPVAPHEKEYARRIAKIAAGMGDSPLKTRIVDVLRECGYGDLVKGTPAPSK